MEATDSSLHGRLYSRLDAAPDRRAVAFYGADGVVRWSTLERFHAEAGRIAAGLASRGLGRGDVCVVVLRSEELSAKVVMGVLLLGAVPLLVAVPTVQGSLSDLPRILAATIHRTRARIVLCDESMAGMREQLERIRTKASFLFGVAACTEEPSAGMPGRVMPPPTDVVAMQLTSGTTGLPRVCVWDHRGLLAALDGMKLAMGLREGDVCLNWTPLYHDMGLVCNLLLCLVHGVPLVLLSPYEFVKHPILWVRGLSDTGSTITWSPNFGFALSVQRVEERELEGIRLDHVRAMWNAAERIHLDTMVAFHDRYRPYGLDARALKTCLGCAENIGGATFSDVDRTYVAEHVDSTALRSRRVARLVEPGSEKATAIVSVGKPYPGMRSRIVSRTGDPLPDGHVGEIALSTPSRMLGYLNDARATRRALHGEWVRTGDLGYLRDGYIFWVGRGKERINVRGKKLDPSDFEPTLFGVEGLRTGCFVAFGVDDEKEGTQRVVIVSEVEEPRSRTVEEISADVRRSAFLKMGVTVDEVVLVRRGTLAKTSSGKRRHRHFRRLYTEGKLEPFATRGETATVGTP